MNTPARRALSPVAVVLIYAAFGAVWIVGSGALIYVLLTVWLERLAGGGADGTEARPGRSALYWSAAMVLVVPLIAFPVILSQGEEAEQGELIDLESTARRVSLQIAAIRGE